MGLGYMLKSMARAIGAWATQLFLILYREGCYVRGLLRGRRNFVVESSVGDRPWTEVRKLALFIHYDRKGVLQPFVRHYLDQLEVAGFTLLFVTNSPRLTQDARAYLKPKAALILRRRNIGYDFGAYKDGIAAIPDRTALDALLIANDSVYGPFHDLSAVIKDMPLTPRDGAPVQGGPPTADVWGITDNWIKRFHLQSYFLLVGPRALASDAFGRFWHSLRYVNSKSWIIRHYEIGLTQRLQAGGLRLRALYPYRTAARAISAGMRALSQADRDRMPASQRAFLDLMFFSVEKGIPLNPTHFFWDHLIGVMGCPFVKRELLRENPANIPFVHLWEEVIGPVCDGFDLDLISYHLELSVKNRSP